MPNPVLKLELFHVLHRRRKYPQWPGMRLTILIGSLFWLGIGTLLAVAVSSLLARLDPTPEDRHAFFLINALAQLFVFCAFLPVYCANLFTREREQQSLGMLLATRLTPAEICWGKLIARMFQPVLGLLVFLPPTFHSALVAGVSGLAFLGTYAVLAVCMFSFGAVGLYCSFRFRRTVVASVAAIAWTVLCWPLVLLVPQALLSLGMAPKCLWGYLSDAQPFWAIVALSGAPIASGSWSLPPQWLWVHTVLWYGAFGGLLVARICCNLRRWDSERILMPH